MAFASVLFSFYFLPAFLVGYWALGIARSIVWRNLWFLLASLGFYAWGEPQYIVLLLGVVALTFVAGLAIDAAQSPGARTGALTLGIGLNLAALGYYKYAGFAVNAVYRLLETQSAPPLPYAGPALPLGISFFVFQSISYLMDVHRQHAKVERNPLYLGLYVAMFPQLVAGPIVRFATVAQQIRRRTHDLEGVYSGLTQFAVGLAQKVLIANTLALAVDDIFAQPPNRLSTGAAWFGAIAYGLQIYFDFSGYSRMAIGLGKVCGFTYPDNFHFPYSARSVSDFWRRWHITLSSWFRDYLYIPLGGNRGGHLATARNLFVVFLLCGLWHGAAWMFVAWGLFHGALLTLERGAWGGWLASAPRPVQHGYTLGAVSMGWVLFRAETLSYAGQYWLAMWGGSRQAEWSLGIARFASTEVVAALVIAASFTTPWLLNLTHRREPQVFSPPTAFGALVQSGATLALLLLSVLALVSGAPNPFIYFRF